MSTIKSSAENLTLNADGANNDIKFQSNGSEVASIDQAGVVTTGGAALNGAVTINESGADVDFRVESDTNTHALFVQGSDGNVGIGTTAPVLGKLHVLASGTSDASLENVAHFGKNSSSRVGLEIRANNTQVDVGMNAQAGPGNFDLSFSSMVSGTPYERMRILSAGGLTFNGDTAAANALDDYEEGTWTPVDASASSITFTSNTGVYTKIGRLVVCSYRLSYPATNSTANSFIGGLPFSSGAGYPTGYNGFNSAGVVINHRITGTNFFVSNAATAATITNNTMSGKEIQGTFILHT